VLGIQLVLLTMGIGGLSFTGLGIDYIRHKLDGTPLGGQPAAPRAARGLAAAAGARLLAGLILVLALCRAC
jgi:hypothetical protein